MDQQERETMRRQIVELFGKNLGGTIVRLSDLNEPSPAETRRMDLVEQDSLLDQLDGMPNQAKWNVIRRLGEIGDYMALKALLPYRGSGQADLEREAKEAIDEIEARLGKYQAPPVGYSPPVVASQPPPVVSRPPVQTPAPPPPPPPPPRPRQTPTAKRAKPAERPRPRPAAKSRPASPVRTPPKLYAQTEALAFGTTSVASVEMTARLPELPELGRLPDLGPLPAGIPEAAEMAELPTVEGLAPTGF